MDDLDDPMDVTWKEPEQVYYQVLYLTNKYICSRLCGSLCITKKTILKASYIVIGE